MHIQRLLKVLPLLEKHSYFLFGPRLTGKSSLIQQDLEEKAFIIDLLKSSLYLELSQYPFRLESMIKAQPKKIIVIDEIQRVPMLLNEVHALIEEKEYTFLLIASSKKQLKKRGTNLLAGRARLAYLHPLSAYELNDHFDLNHYLLYGGLPKIYLSEEPDEDLSVPIFGRKSGQKRMYVKYLAFLSFLRWQP